jgi:hypothetical protein
MAVSQAYLTESPGDVRNRTLLGCSLGSRREGSSQGGQFHQIWLVRDYGDNAANKNWPARF